MRQYCAHLAKATQRPQRAELKEDWRSAAWRPAAGELRSAQLSMVVAQPVVRVGEIHCLGAGEYRTAQLDALMGRPYGRVVVLHLAIVGGGFLVLTLGSPLVPLALLVVLKTGLDLRAHIREHASPEVRPETVSSSAG